MEDLYTADEFVSGTIERGYALRSQKAQIIEWCKKHPKEYYVETDMIELYRYLDARKIGGEIPFGKWRSTWNGHRTTKHYNSDNGNR